MQVSAKNYFQHLHDVECNQKFDSVHPYSFHLDLVYRQGVYFDELLKLPINMYSEFAYAIFYGHDAIEDCRVTYNDIKNIFSEDVAEIIYLCTENKGRNREERKDDNWYKELATNKYAVFVKLCDIVANVKYSLLTNSGMIDKYKQEYFNKVKPNLLPYYPEYGAIFQYLEDVFKLQAK